ncbi:MAG: tyrosine-type recombinase/integrase, partial [Gammaproteobacteria bacterium]
MLTDTKARAARPKAAPYKLADRDGLYLHVSPSGAKSWRFDYRFAGARETLTIGRYPDVSLEQARRGKRRCGFISHTDARAMVAGGESPARAKQQDKANARVARANTVQAIAEKWYEPRATVRSKSWKDNARRWLDQDIYPMLGSKPIRDVTADDVERLVRRIAEKRGVKSAHYARLLVAGVFKSLPRHLGAGNPARDVAGVLELPKGKPRGRALSGKEIPAFLEAMDRYKGRKATKLAAQLLLLTFVRK